MGVNQAHGLELTETMISISKIEGEYIESMTTNSILKKVKYFNSSDSLLLKIGAHDYFDEVGCWLKSHNFPKLIDLANKRGILLIKDLPKLLQ